MSSIWTFRMHFLYIMNVELIKWHDGFGASEQWLYGGYNILLAANVKQFLHVRNVTITLQLDGRLSVSLSFCSNKLCLLQQFVVIDNSKPPTYIFPDWDSTWNISILKLYFKHVVPGWCQKTDFRFNLYVSMRLKPS